jgi:hypothetical protein
MVAAEAKGVPTVMLVTAVLIDMAKGTARACGLPNLAIVTMSEIFYGASREQIAGITAAYCPALESSLLHDPQATDNDR